MSGSSVPGSAVSGSSGVTGVTTPGWGVMGSLGAVGCLYFLSLSTPVPELLDALRRARVPEVVGDLAVLIYRYIFILFATFRSMGLMSEATPMYILTLFGTGLRAGLFIYIFNQFFRGLPKEIEEAAFVDGAGTWYTYFRIMLVNAMPAVITVTVFSLVWQYTDSFYSQLFRIPTDMLLAKRLSTLQNNIQANLKIMNVRIQRLYVDAGVVLTILPLLILYLLLQRRFIEGVERSGIVG